MNNSIQQEIAAPKVCKNFLWLLSIVFVNLLIIAGFFTLLILKQNGTFDNKYLTAPIFMGVITSIALVVAILLRKQHTLMLTVLTLAAASCAALLLYHNAINAKGSTDMIWRMVTISLSFALLIFALLFLGIYYAKPRERKAGALSATKYLTYCAMFAAISVICKIIGNAITAAIPFAGLSLKVTIVYIPWVLGGIVLGPIGGFATAAIGDFIGQLTISTGGMPLPSLTISNGLFAVFPAIAYKLLMFKSTYPRTLLSVCIGTVVSAMICTLGISSYTLYLAYSFPGYDTFYAYLIALRLPQVLIIVINLALVLMLTPALIKARIIRRPVTVFFD